VLRFVVAFPINPSILFSPHLTHFSCSFLSYEVSESKSLQSSSSLNNLDHHDDDGDDQQDMNESTTHMTNKSQQPQNKENHTYGPKHVRLLSDDRMHPSISIYFWGPLMTRIIQRVIANGLPTTGKRQKFGIIL